MTRAIALAISVAEKEDGAADPEDQDTLDQAVLTILIRAIRKMAVSISKHKMYLIDLIEEINQFLDHGEMYPLQVVQMVIL